MPISSPSPLAGAPNLDMDQTALLGLALGYIVPLIVAGVVRSHWRAELKTLVALMVSVLAAVFTLAARNQLDATNGARLSLAVVALSAYFYRLWWQRSGVTDALENGVNLFGAVPAEPEEPQAKPKSDTNENPE